VTLDAKTEFEDIDPNAEPQPDADAAPAAGVDTPDPEKAQLASTIQTLTSKLQSLEQTSSADKATLGKLRQVFNPNEAALSPRDKFIRDEIQRLVPELNQYGNNLGAIGQLLPEILEVMQATVEERNTERATTAQEYMRGQMADLGLDPKDEEAAGVLEETLVAIIKRDQKLLQAWAAGRMKTAVNGAMEKVQAKMFAPVRAKAKRGAVNTIMDGPKASPRGGAAPGPGTPAHQASKVDLNDLSRAGDNKVHDAAFDYLQDLMSKD